MMASRSRDALADEVGRELAALAAMSYRELQERWRRLHRGHPPKRVARDLLELGVAWKIQERAHGGLGAGTRRRLTELARILDQNGDLARSRITRLRPGAKLVREWRGVTHTVTVVDDGFDWRGQRWRSLSAIARAITGAHWSGPRFFGLTSKAARASIKEVSDA